MKQLLVGLTMIWWTGASLLTGNAQIVDLPNQPQLIEIKVTTTEDAHDLDTADGKCDIGGRALDVGRCSLRAAIQEANKRPGSQTITIPGGMYNLSLGQLEITDGVVLRGAGQSSTMVSGEKKSRVFAIKGHQSNPVHISGVAITNGRPDFISGAGLYIGEAVSVTLSDCAVTKNRTDTPGGGIYNLGDLELMNCMVSENVSYQQGGGISNHGNLKLINSTVSHNEGGRFIGATGVTAYGGGLFNAGTVEVIASTISNNIAARGGGIMNANGGSLGIKNSTISGNAADTHGGGILNHGHAGIAFATITNNEAGEQGAGVEPSGGGGIYNTNVPGDSSVLMIGSTILAGNKDRWSYTPDCWSTTPLHSMGHNLVGVHDVLCPMLALADILGSRLSPKNPLLDPLSSNVGPTQTHSLKATSPAIDYAPTRAPIGADRTCLPGSPFSPSCYRLEWWDCPAQDQVGMVRPRNFGCDIGAVER